MQTLENVRTQRAGWLREKVIELAEEKLEPGLDRWVEGSDREVELCLIFRPRRAQEEIGQERLADY